MPVWQDGVGYLDPIMGEVLPAWDQAFDELDQDDAAEPLHVVRFGDQVDVKGVLAGTPDADQCIRYLSKYLTKNLGDALDGLDLRRTGQRGAAQHQLQPPCLGQGAPAPLLYFFAVQQPLRRPG
ncbi:replication initiator [Nonomuraea sp. H19]|uniref:replication initiator n=1 Tax=Nonomuraea sp. H19 TaxID=3452206 RepID=UPI003F8AFB3C